jgi:hypothetical protein
MNVHYGTYMRSHVKKVPVICHFHLCICPFAHEPRYTCKMPGNGLNEFSPWPKNAKGNKLIAAMTKWFWFS